MRAITPRTRVFAIMACALAAGCGSVRERITDLTGDEDNAVPATELVEFEPAVKVAKLWSGHYGKGTDEQYLKILPATDGDRVFTADREGRMFAVEAKTGDVIWEERDKKLRISGGPGAGEGLVLAGTSDAQVVARDATSGEIKWIADVSSEVLAAPKIDSGVVVARTGDGKLFGLRAEDGKRLWIYDRSIPSLTLRGTGAPVIVDGVVVAGFDSGRLAALELRTGKPLWETRLIMPSGRSDLERMVDVDCAPVVVGDTAFVAGFQGRVAAVSLDDGKLQWARDISSYADLAADDDRVYVTDDNGVVWALDRTNGASVWKQEGLKARGVTGPAVFGDYVVVGDFEGYLHWLKATDGTFAYRTQIDKQRIIVPAMRLDEALLGFSTSGRLTALRPE